MLLFEREESSTTRGRPAIQDHSIAAHTYHKKELVNLAMLGEAYEIIFD